MKTTLLLFIGLFVCFCMLAQTPSVVANNEYAGWDKNAPNAVQKASILEIPSLTNGAGKNYFGAGKKTQDVTKPNNWRWSGNYYGYSQIGNIVEETDNCGQNHIYVFGEKTGATVEYLMEFGGEYSMLVLRGKADDPAPVELEIYVDGKFQTTTFWNEGNNCNDSAIVWIPHIEFGTHAIAVRFANDFYDSKLGIDRNFYLDGLRVIRSKYKANWYESLDFHSIPDWYDESKLGLSIHWGVYAIPAWAPIGNYSEWYFNNMHNKNEWVKEYYDPNFPNDKKILTFQHHESVFGKEKSYDDFMKNWSVPAKSYDPDKWMQFAKDIGAEYIFLTTKHHDGICLWPTKYTSRNTMDMDPAFKLDIVGKFVEVARHPKDPKVNLKVGLYYSLYEWFNPAYHKTCNCENANIPIKEGDYTGYKPLAKNANYVDSFMIPQIKELIDLYHPDFLYFDGEDKDCGDINRPTSCGRDSTFWKMNEVVAYFYNVAEARGQEVYVNNRLGFKKEKHGDLYNVEYGSGTEGLDHKWADWIGVGESFGYKPVALQKPENLKDEKQLIEELVVNVSRNGNLDINVGPDSCGKIPEYDSTIIKAMGNWLNINKEAIKGTRPWSKKQHDIDGNVRFTVKGDYLYAIFLEWPERQDANSYLFKLKDVNPVAGSSIQMLGAEGNLIWKWENDTLIIKYPKDKKRPNEYAWSFKINIDDQAIPYLPSLTHGDGENNFGVGKKTQDVTKPNNWRWSGNYFGYGNIEKILKKPDACGDSHIYVYGENSGDTIEYLMKFGGNYSQLVLRGIADQPAPVRMKIYIDGLPKATAQWDDGDLCNDLAFVKIEGIKYGTHAIAVQFINDLYEPPEIDRNFYLDALMVISNDEKGIPVFVGDNIQAAVNDNPAGTTFIIKSTDRDGEEGIHRMQPVIPKNGNNFIGEDGAVLSGAMLLDPEGWRQEGDLRVHDGPGGLHNEVYHEGECNEFKTCQYPEDLFIDNRFCQQVNSKDQLTTFNGNEGEILRWYFERDDPNDGLLYDGKGSHKIYIKGIPEGHKLEISVTGYAFSGPRIIPPEWPPQVGQNPNTYVFPRTDAQRIPNGVTIRNLIIEKFANPGQFGAIGFQDPGDYWTIEDNEVRLNHGAGLQAGSNSLVKNNYVHDNGQIGIKASRNIDPIHVENTIIEGNRIIQNGKEEVGFNWTWEGGGTKFSKTKNLRVSNNIVRENRGAGLWTDIDNVGTIYENNIVEDNRDNGIFHEISYDAIIRNNTVRRNGFGRDWNTISDSMMHAQIMVSTSKNVEIYNNFVDAGDNMNGIIVRYDKDRAPYISENVSVHHNQIIVSQGNKYGFSGGWIGTSQPQSLSESGHSFDFDVYQLATPDQNHWIWENGNGTNQLLSFNEFQAEGQELNGLCNGTRAMYFNDGSESSISTLVNPVVFGEAYNIDFDWSEKNPDVKIGSRTPGQENNFSARFQGTIKVENSATYSFRITADDGIRFWLKDKVGQEKLASLERWNDNPPNVTPSQYEIGSLLLEKGNLYPYRLEYFHHGNAEDNNAKLRLEWKEKGSNDAWEIVPATAIGPPIDMPMYGLQGSYYNDPANIADGNEVLVRTDQQINFNWGKYDPDSRMDNDGVFAVVWEGKIKAFYDGVVYFFTRFNSTIESMKLWIDGSPLTPEDGQRYRLGMEANKPYNIKIEYKKFSNAQPSSNVLLEWESYDKTQQSFQVVPPYCLYLPDKPKPITMGVPETGLLAKYYNMKSEYLNEQNWKNWETGGGYPLILNGNKSLKEEMLDPGVTKYVPNINFNWWTGSPDYRIGADYFVSKWEGKLEIKTDDPTDKSEVTKSFYWKCDDGGILKIGGNEIVNTWENNNGTNPAPATLRKNTPLDFIAIQFERGGSSSSDLGNSVLKWAELTPILKAKALNGESNALKLEYEIVPPGAFMPSTNADNVDYKLLVFGKDRSNSISILNSLQYKVTNTNNVQDLGTMDLSAFNQIWYVDYKQVPNSKGKQNIQEYIMHGGKILFVGENYTSTNSAYPLWRDSLLNALGAGGVKQSQTINPTKIGYYYTNPEHILRNSPFIVDSIKHLSAGNGAFKSIGNGTVIAGTEHGGKGYPVAVAFDYGELSLAPNSRAVVYMNSNNGENWDMYAANIAEYFKQPKTETILAVQDGYGQPGSTGNVSVNLGNTQEIAGVQFTLTDIPDFLTVATVGSTIRTSGFTVGFNEGNSGALTVILYNSDGNVIQPGEGPIAEITYNISSGTTMRDSAKLQLSHVFLSDREGSSVSVKPKNGIFRFTPSKGDVNADGVIDILDVVRAVNIILGIPPEPTEYELYAANCNSDNNLNVLDIIRIVNLILDNPQQKSSFIVKSQVINTIWVENNNLPSGHNVEIPVMADISREVAGLQLRFSYDPHRLTLGEPVTTIRSSRLNMSSRSGNGDLTVLLYSLDGTVIHSGEGPILYIPAEVKSDAGAVSGLKLEDVKMVDSSAHRIPASIITGNGAGIVVPTDFVLHQNYPNPFSSETVLQYGLSRSAKISIKVYNSFGQVIRELVSCNMQAGFYTVTWDGKDKQGSSVLPGVYIYQLEADGNFMGRGKMVVLK